MDALNSTLTDNNILLEQHPCQQQQTKMPQSNITMDWTRCNSLPMPVVSSQVAIIKNKVYMFGGYNDSGELSTVLMAPINEDGTLGQWTIISQLPAATSNGQIIVTKNKVHLIGGNTDTNYISAVSDVYTATIYDDGNIGKWVESYPLPTPVAYSKALVIKDKVYLFGGYNGFNGYLSTVFTTTIKRSGKLSRWVASSPLPTEICNSQAIITKKYIYLLGKKNPNGNLSTTLVASINDDGTLGQWKTDYRLPTLVAHSQAVTVNNKVYLLGGYNDYDHDYNSIGSCIFVANIDDNGILKEWTIGPQSPVKIYNTQILIIKDKIYLLGGDGEEGYLSDVYTASINTDSTS